MLKRSLILLVVLGWQAVALSAEAAQTVPGRVLGPGVSMFDLKTSAIGHPNLVHVAAVSGSAPVKLKVLSGAGKKTASQICRESHCLLAVNAGFFNRSTGVPIAGTHPVVKQMLGFNVPGIGPGAVTLIDQTANKPQDRLPTLPDDLFSTKREPRTIACKRQNGDLLLVVVDGRQPGSPGATLAEARALTRQLGCYTAVNFDGGGSSEMVAAGQVVSKPSNGLAKVGGRMKLVEGLVGVGPVVKANLERPLSSILAVVPSPKSATGVEARVQAPPANALTGGVVLPRRLSRPAKLMAHHAASKSKPLTVIAIGLLLTNYLILMTYQRRSRRRPVGETSPGRFWRLHDLLE